MTSGFSGGGPDFYGGIAGRSMAHTGAMGNNQAAAAAYRTQIPGMFMDSTAQIVNQGATGFIGKRTLAEFQAQHQNHPRLNELLLRSVKSRMEQHALPVSPLSPMNYSTLARNFCSPASSASISQRYGQPLLQQLRPQTISLGGSLPTTQPGVPYMNPSRIRVSSQDTEKKMMNQLQELEKQLLDDNDQEEDAVSVITNTNSEWSETMQSLISSSPQSISPSSTSSITSTSSSSPSVASPAASCSKQTVMEAASALSEGKMDVFNEISARLARVANPKGNSEQRLMGYMTSALKSRVNPVENRPLVAELFTKEHNTATQSLYDLSTCFQLGFKAANLAILDATLDGQSNSYKLHVIDFDIGKGLQYKNLISALSNRQSGKPAMVKITAVDDNGDDERLRSVGEALHLLSKRFRVSLKFKVLASPKLSDLSRESLGCEPDETLAVNFAFKLYRMPDESVSTENPRDELLRRVKGLAPRVVTLVEQEMNTNTAPFVARVGEATAYYAALLESLDSTVPREHSERAKVEEVVSRRIANSVACEGRDRIERCEVFGKWRARMGMAGFELKPLNQNVAESMAAALSSGNGVNPGFTVKEENGGVCFRWMGRTLTVASAWR